ncbi:hypothetical protein [Nonomuraea sp. NPDC049646]|uniref:hypothetical protein n=1 Tax=unclassified Nonomuraea TaxID=2593643 RepID=UPI0037AB0BCB
MIDNTTIPRVTLDDALALWDALTDDERRAVFADFWRALDAVRADDMTPIREMASSWPVTVHIEKTAPGCHAMFRETFARGPASAQDVIDVDTVLGMLRS